MIGVNAVVNARAGKQHLNEDTDKERHMWLAAYAIKNRIAIYWTNYPDCRNWIEKHLPGKIHRYYED